MAKSKTSTRDPEKSAPPQPDPSLEHSCKKISAETAPGVSRRSFLEWGVGGFATVGTPWLRKSPQQEATAAPATGTGTVSMVLKVNGTDHRLHLEPRVTLLDALRENL